MKMVKCTEVLLLVFLGLIEPSPVTSNSMMELPFPKMLPVHGRNVSCEATYVSKLLGNVLYTCENISVDGVKVFHGNDDYKDNATPLESIEISSTGFSVDPETNNNLCPDCPCGSYTAEPNDILALCSEMLKLHSIEEVLISAYAPHPVCKNKGIKQSRIKFYLQDREPRWLHVETDNGYVSKLECLVSKTA